VGLRRAFAAEYSSTRYGAEGRAGQIRPNSSFSRALKVSAKSRRCGARRKACGHWLSSEVACVIRNRVYIATTVRGRRDSSDISRKLSQRRRIGVCVGYCLDSSRRRLRTALRGNGHCKRGANHVAYLTVSNGLHPVHWARRPEVLLAASV
jgi:hypothetical protein